MLERWADLRRSLLALRPLLVSDFATQRFFDELLEANEFGVALYALCDYLLEQPVMSVGLEEIRRIEDLHRKMQLRDECSAELRTKYRLNRLNEA
jgi:hypothetical protein